MCTLQNLRVGLMLNILMTKQRKEHRKCVRCYIRLSLWLCRWFHKCLPVSRHIIGEGNGTPLQYSCLENPMGGGAQQAAVHGVAKSPTQPSDFTFTFPFHALEKEMATQSSVLAWRIPEMVEPGGLPSMGSHWVGHDGSGLAAAVADISCCTH